MPAEEQAQRVTYCRKHNVHHLFELLATKVLMERPQNPFAYLRDLLTSVEENEEKSDAYDPTQIRYATDGSTSGGVREGQGNKGNATSSSATAPKAGETASTNGSGAKRRKITLGTFGLNNAGKTTLLSALGGNVDRNCTPTVGFTPIQFATEEYDVCIFDLGGAVDFRGIWVHYFHDCHGLIYVVDSAGGETGLAESLKVFGETAGHPCMQGKPVLVMANKKDLPTSCVHGGGGGETVVPEAMIADVLLPGTPFREIATCGIEEDDQLESGVEWLLATVSEMYDTLSTRVAEDTAHVKAEKERKRQERLAAMREE